MASKTTTVSPAGAIAAGCSATCDSYYSGVKPPSYQGDVTLAYTNYQVVATGVGNWQPKRIKVTHFRTYSDGTTSSEVVTYRSGNYGDANPWNFPAVKEFSDWENPFEYTETDPGTEWRLRTIDDTITGVEVVFEESAPTTYTITTAVSPAGGGTTTGDGTYSAGASCTITATPAAGYVFLRWEKNGVQVSTTSSYAFAVNSSATYTAVFSSNVVTVTLVAHNGWGKVAFAGETPTTGTVSKTVAAGTSLTIEASKTGANTAEFTWWSGNPGGTQSANPLTITPLVNVTYEAYFRYLVTAYVAQLSDPTAPLPVGQVRITRDGNTGSWRNKATYQVVDSNTITVEQRSLGGDWTFVKWRWRRTYETSWTEVTPSYPSITLPTDNLEVVALFERTPTHLLINSSDRSSPVQLVYDPATNLLVADY